MEATGTLTTTGSTVTVRFDRVMDASPAQVFAAISEPDQIGKWLAPAELDPVVGGKVHLVWPDGQGEMHGQVRVFDAPAVLEYSWQEEASSLLRLEVAPHAVGSSLRLIHSGTSKDDAIGFGAGWQAHLEALDEVLAGKPSSAADRDARYAQLRPDYEALASL